MVRPSVGRWRWANVPVPEPHTGGLVAGVVLQALRPWPLPVDGPLRWIAGGTLFLLGLGLVGWAVITVGQRDLVAASAVVTDGPYRYSRNPMYLGWTGLYLGVVLIAVLAWSLVLFPIVALAVHRTVQREERRLEQVFGEDYRAYCRKVHRYG